MESNVDAEGRLAIVEKPLSPERLTEIEGRGRGRLLHPKSELKQFGVGVAESESLSPQTVAPLSIVGSSQSLGHSHPETDGVQHIPDGQAPVLRVNDLKVYFPIKKGFLQRVVGHVKAVDGISFSVYRGQTLGLVGESGCGKTTTGRAILRLIPITAGKVEFHGDDWAQISGTALRQARRKIQIVFQDPYSSLNPRLTIEAMLTEAMSVHRIGANHLDRRDRAAKLLEEVGLLAEHLRRYPHEFSGGQRQRLCIARALSVEPEFLICDESVSALDVSVQAQVLNLLKDLQEKHGLTYIFISHDLSVVKFMSDMMAVMHAGKIVEFGPSEEIYAAPREDYTRKLIAAIPEVSLPALEKRLGGNG
jgi:peptide/nickel transport system ATP-binding protein